MNNDENGIFIDADHIPSYRLMETNKCHADFYLLQALHFFLDNFDDKHRPILLELKKILKKTPENAIKTHPNHQFLILIDNFSTFFPRPSPAAVNNKVVISRSCFWQRADASKDECLSLNTPSYIRTEFCETCTTDGCNGAAQYGPIAMLIALPIAIAKLFAFL